MSDDVTQQVREMAKLSIYSNKISEIQEKNLKMYPFVFFDGVKSVRIDYDFSNHVTWETEENSKTENIAYQANEIDTSHFRVSYFLTIDETYENISIDKRFDAIEASVRNLFWKDVKIQVYLNDTLKFESKPNVRK